MKKYIITLLLLLTASACAPSLPAQKITPAPQPVPASSTTTSTPPQPSYTIPLTVGTKKILVEVARTDAEKEQGLSGRDMLTDTQGMLFDFTNDKNSKPGFWMKDMKFDLDLIWVKNGKIIAITPDIKKPTSSLDTLPLYYPPSSIDYVLEVRAGWSKKNNVTVGDSVTF